MFLAISSSPSPSVLLEMLPIPESTGLLLDDVTVAEGGACIQAGVGAEGSCCEFKQS